MNSQELENKINSTKVKIKDVEIPVKYVKEIKMQSGCEEFAKFELLLEIPFSKSFLKDFIVFEQESEKKFPI